METKEIWEKRAELLRKARDGKLTFREFCLLDMHEETNGFLAKDKPTLSEKGLATLCAIETYLETI
jgi:hypothetical protein